MSNETNNYAKSLAELWSVVVRYKWRFVVPTFLVMIGVLGGTMLLPRKYKAEALFERKTDMVLTEINRRNGSSTFANSRQTVVEQLTGDTAINEMLMGMTPQVLDELAEGYKPINVTQLRNDLRMKLLVKYDLATHELDRIRLLYINDNPKLTKYVVNTLVDKYIKRVHLSMDEKLSQSSEFFKKEVDRCRENIDQLENNKLDFEIKFAEMLPDSPSNSQATLTEFELELSDKMQQLDIATMRSESLEQSLLNTSENTPSYITERNPKRVALENKLDTLLDKKKEYISVLKMTARHPDLINIDEQITKLQQQVQQTEEKVVTQTRISNNPKHAEISLMLNNTLAEKAALDKQTKYLARKIDQIKNQTSNIFAVRSDYRQITQNVNKQQRQLTFWEDNLRRVNISLAAETGDRGISLRLISPATNIGAPISPNPKQGITAAIVLGLIVGGTSVFFGHRTNESFSDSEQISEEFDLPVMGAVSEIITKQQKRIHNTKRIVLFPVNAIAMIAALTFMTNMLFTSLRDADHQPITDTVNTNDQQTENNITLPKGQE